LTGDGKSLEALTRDELKDIFKGKTVCIMGSAPSVNENTCNNIEQHDIVVRINNYKTRGIDLHNRAYDFTEYVGARVDYHYSFYGGSIRTTQNSLKEAGIKGHLCKCPNEECHVTDWHKERNFIQGGDFRPIYRRRHDFWIAPVYIPEREHYMKLFHELGDHVPTTGFACIWEIAQLEPKYMYITGFDFFRSGKHNTDEIWRAGHQSDPIKHLPDTEAKLLKQWAYKNKIYRLDEHLRYMLYGSK
jgi:hypothetical protein